ncbi:hypothetical protein FS749_003377 [Ceratobasidium sp. UAMH 11750]|nr:hypothetical protein FS749_003377 [Ceratobasidium sp. UAMH 11750]
MESLLRSTEGGTSVNARTRTTPFPLVQAKMCVTTAARPTASSSMGAVRASRMSKARHARSKRGKHCPSGSEVCSVPGTLDGWECVKTHEDLESCGGCAL